MLVKIQIQLRSSRGDASLMKNQGDNTNSGFQTPIDLTNRIFICFESRVEVDARVYWKEHPRKMMLIVNLTLPQFSRRFGNKSSLSWNVSFSKIL